VLGYGHSDVIIGQDEQRKRGKAPCTTARKGIKQIDAEHKDLFSADV